MLTNALESLAILSPRMVIRPFRQSDSKELSDAVTETWQDLNCWMQWAINKDEKTNVSNCRVYLGECNERFKRSEDFTFGCFLKENNQLAVSVRLAHLDKQANSFEFCGVWCRKKFQQTGLASEAVNAITRFTFAVLNADEFIISHAIGNYKSRRMIEGLGFKESHTKTMCITLPDGNRQDAQYYSLSLIGNLPELNAVWNFQK